MGVSQAKKKWKDKIFTKQKTILSEEKKFSKLLCVLALVVNILGKSTSPPLFFCLFMMRLRAKCITTKETQEQKTYITTKETPATKCITTKAKHLQQRVLFPFTKDTRFFFW